MEASAQKHESARLLVWTPWKRRLPLLASVACPGAVGLWLESAREPRVWLAVAASLAVGLIAAQQASRERRALGWGAALVLGSLGPRGDYLALDACGAVGAAVCAAAASVAIVRIPAPGGVVGKPASSAVAAVAAIGAAWFATIVARLAPQSDEFAWMTEYPRLWAAGAAASSALVLLAVAEQTRRRRPLELGIPERVQSMRALLWMLIAVALLVAVRGRAHADSLAQLVVAATCTAVGAAALHGDAVRVMRLTRRIAVLLVAGAGLALLGASVVAAGGGDPWGAIVVAVAVAVGIGAVAPALEGSLRPARRAWLDAFARASDEASRAEPEDAIREVLGALRAPAGLLSPSPELWTFTPSTATRVDSAGYLHDRDAELPEALVAAAAAEPEGTLRADVLDALEVRRPDLRLFSKWMTDQGALLAAVVAYGGEAEGLLVLPRVARAKPPTLEEVRALKNVADRLAAACRTRAARVRMLARAIHADERAEAALEQTERLLHERALDLGRDSLAATRLARPVTVGGYSAGSRMALEALERRTAIGAPIAVVAPRGVDAIPYLARAHLAGARRDAPLVLVDATSAQEHDMARWGDPHLSPLALADRGMLVLLDGAALPHDVQQLIARAVAEKRAPWDRPQPLDIQLALTAVLRPEQLVAEARLDPSLALRLADTRTSVVVLPRLCDRVEDLRAIITDRLAREGMGVLGRPIGIEQAAYALLIEHPFPGEDAELAVLVQRLVARCRGDVVRVADVDALRLALPASGPAHPRSAGRRKSPLSAGG